MTNKNATWLQSFRFQIVRLERTFTNLNTNRMILLKRIFYKHRNVGQNSITNAIGDAGIYLIHVIKLGYVSFVINSNINSTTIGISKCDNLFVKLIRSPRFKFNIFSFEFHKVASIILLLLLYAKNSLLSSE